MTALAELLVKNGMHVSGSDTEEVFFTDAILKKLRIEVKEGFTPENIPKNTDLVLYSTAYARESNQELASAFEKKVPVLSYPEALGLLTQEKMTIAVAGTHGKTTTSALLADTLKTSGLDPSAIIGSEIRSWGGNALSGKGQYFIVEADEYQDKFQYYHPLGIILTSVDWDHPDFFPTLAEYEACFTRFVARLPRHGFLVACGDSASVKRVAQKTNAKTITYGFHPENDIHISDYHPLDPNSDEGKKGYFQTFSVEKAGVSLGTFHLRLSGKHNALNAAAVIAVGEHLKLSHESIQKGIENFSGTKRRFEKMGENHGALIYDDYAHHPEEIKATLEAFRDLYPEKNITVIFHPHTFTRTKALLQEFAQSFDGANHVFLLNIYGSAREVQGGVSSEDLVNLINRYTPGKARLAPNREALIQELAKNIRKDDIIVTMGAGDVWQIAEALVKNKE